MMLTMCREVAPRAVAAAVASIIVGASGASLAPPPFSVIDRYQVNMASGYVAPSLADVSIGDAALGLSHSISTFSSNFVNYEGEGPLGPKDKYYGGIIKELHHKPNDTPDPSQWVYVMRAFDGDTSFDFGINADGTFTSYNLDPRQTLEWKAGVGFVWTKEDGTVVTFASSAQSWDARTVSVGANVPISNIVRPNGFAIQIYHRYEGMDSLSGVTTNTGYQLKYIYVENNAPLANDDPSNTEIPAADSLGWSLTTPKYVVAINNAFDFCSPTDDNPHTSVADACPNLTQQWPTVTYTWPDGMPRAMYLGDTTFSVTDAMGGVTSFLNRPYSKPDWANDPQYRTPRIVAIKSSRSDVPVVNYDYQTLAIPDSSTWGYPTYFCGPVAQVKSAWIGADGIGYGMNQPYEYPGTYVNGASGVRSVTVTSIPEYGPWQVMAWDRSLVFETHQSNRLLSITEKPGGVITTLGYDARNNISSITKNGIVVQTASYPLTCSNRKTCNQATWVKDANNNETDYEYEPNSGQVSRVRMPAGANGVRPEIRYTYQPKFAYYKNAAGGFQQADTPVYLLTQERTCVVSATLADGSGCAAGASDELVTDYDYGPAQGPNNLLLRGVVVTAYGNGTKQMHRTCYRYDNYGNRIGETTANAGLTSCY